MSGTLLLLVYIAVFFGLLWVMAIRPQRRRAQAMQTLLAALKPGDEVVTVGGLYGTITEIEDEETVLIEVAENTEMRFARGAIARLANAKDAAAEEPSGAASTEPS